MTPKEAQAHIKSRIWKEIAKAQLDLSELSEEKLEQLVDIASGAALSELDYEIERVDKESRIQPFPEDESERVLWEGRPFLSLTTHYRITNERIRITYGLLGKQRVDIELLKIQDMEQTQRVTERLMNLGDITIQSHDPMHPVVVLENISDVQRVHEIIRRARLDARKEHNFGYREEM
jgi:hypothetical protein